MGAIKPLVVSVTQNRLVLVLVTLIVMDVVFGCLRAAKERDFNSTIGINGAIRKAGMLVSVMCMAYLDMLIKINLIGFIPEAVREYLPVESVGVMEFFAILYIVYEVTSVLKNMALAGLPVEKIWRAISDFLRSNTSEIADVVDEDDDDQDAAKS